MALLRFTGTLLRAISVVRGCEKVSLPNEFVSLGSRRFGKSQLRGNEGSVTPLCWSMSVSVVGGKENSISSK